MPAIDPDRLTRQVAKAVAAFGDSIELRRRTLDILEFYADRTRRPGPSTEVEDVPPSFGAPRPVMRALGRGLVQAAAGRVERALAAAEALWRADYRETRTLAAALVGSLQDRAGPAWVEQHAIATEDGVVLSELAGRGLAGWRSSDPSGFVGDLTRWLDSSRRPVQHLALLAIIAAVDDPAFRRLPPLFPILSGRSGSFRGEIRKAFTAAVRSLAVRTPAETTHFLLAEIGSGDPGAVRLARSILASLPPDNAGRVQKALSAGRRS